MLILPPYAPLQRYYATIQASHALLPAFGRDEYLSVRASATVATSLITGVPLIATRALLDAYAFLSEEDVFLQVQPAGQPLAAPWALRARRPALWTQKSNRSLLCCISSRVETAAPPLLLWRLLRFTACLDAVPPLLHAGRGSERARGDGSGAGRA